MNGTVIPKGTYKLLIRSLKITGNPDRLEDYDMYVSQPFRWVDAPPEEQVA
jgi:hypothetical protein